METLVDLAVAAVNPVPWARSQMAFTLAFHIILVPLGVSWAFMALIANYRGDQARRRRRDAAGPALVEVHGGDVRRRRGHRHRADASSSACCGRSFMGQWGEAFGVPFAFEGLFFFTEAIFIAIYIYGWRRLKPWTHFWTGVPIVDRRHPRQRVGGRRQRVDERAVRVHARLGRQGRRRRPVGGDLQRRHAADGRPHGGGGLRRRRLPDRVGLRGRHAAGPPRPLPPARLPHRVHASPPIATPIQMAVGDSLARWVYNNQPVKFAAIELVPKTEQRRARDAARPPQLRTARSPAGSRSPAWRRGCRTRATGTAPWSGPRHRPGRRPADHLQVNTVHLAWDVMVGLGTLLFLLSALVLAVLDLPTATCRRAVVPRARRRRRRRSRSSPWRPAGWSPRSAANRGSSTTT